MPDRIDSINNRLTLRKDTIFVENPLQDHGKEPILAVHKQEYIDYLQTAYQKWVSIGGNPEGVMPDVFAVRDFANPKKSHLESSPETRIVQGDAGYYSFDFCSVLVDGTFQAAYDAVQTALTAADHLSEEIKKGASLPSVFALIRPPGHHSHTDLCGGYCFFNNAAIVTKYCRDVLNLGKISK